MRSPEREETWQIVGSMSIVVIMVCSLYLHLFVGERKYLRAWNSVTGCCRSLFGCSPRLPTSEVEQELTEAGGRVLSIPRDTPRLNQIFITRRCWPVLGGDSRNINYTIGRSGKHLLISRGEFQCWGLERVDVLICRLLTSVWHRWDQDRKLICSGAWPVTAETVLASPGPLLSPQATPGSLHHHQTGLSLHTLSCMHSFLSYVSTLMSFEKLFGPVKWLPLFYYREVLPIEYDDTHYTTQH